MNFANRIEAGHHLSEKLLSYKNSADTIVLGLPRGGLPVAYEIAKTLRLPLDLLLVKKIGAPYEDELAIGAISIDDTFVENTLLTKLYNISSDYIEEKIKSATKQLEERNRKYRHGANAPKVAGKNVIIVDDGVATGASMKAAISVLQKMQAKKIIVAIPVSPLDTFNELLGLADELICLTIPDDFFGVGQMYNDFHQLTDEEVVEMMDSAQAWQK